MNVVKINIYSEVGTSFCVAAEDGEQVFRKISEAIKNGKKVVISFLNVEIVTSAFLNSAIGQLYGSFDEDLLKNSLGVEDIDDDDKLLLKRVVETAKAYYKDKDQFEKSIKMIMEG
jgi:hypothetical protein